MLAKIITDDMAFSLTRVAFTLAAGEQRHHSCFASQVRCLSATGTLYIAFNGKEKGEFPPGVGFTAPPGQAITSVDLFNETAAAITIVLYLALGSVNDARFVLDAGASISATIAPNGPLTCAAAVTALATSSTSLLAENLARKEAIICNDDLSNAVYIRGDNTAAIGGLKLAPGATAVLDTSGALWAYNPHGSDVVILPSEVEL